jgi:spore maturation protein CgeB
MGFKLFNVSSMYPGYLESFYKTHSTTNDMSYEEHYQLLMDDTTEFVGSYIRNFRRLGINAACVIANDTHLQSKWKSEKGIRAVSNSLIIYEQIKAFAPDILWIEDLHYIDCEWFKFIRQNCRSIKGIVAYHCSPFNETILEKLRMADFVFTCTPGLKIDLEKAGLKSFMVYHAFDSDLLTRLNSVNLNSPKNLVFSGSLVTGGSFHNSRISLIDGILKAKVDLALFVTLERSYRIKAKQILYYLSGLMKKMGLQDLIDHVPVFEHGAYPVLSYSPEILSSNNPPLYGIDMYNLFNTSRIILNMHIGVAGDYAGNMRLFEATGIGSCLLTDNKKNMSELFDLDKEVVVYDSPEDCITKAKWLLENEAERMNIAIAGQKRTLISHTVEKRCKSIIGIIENEFFK